MAKSVVEFKGRVFCILPDRGGLEDYIGPLAPMDHVDSDGHVTVEAALFGESFAHVCADGYIRRYHIKIGERKDLKLVKVIE
jgi:hypothetical protein